MTPLQPCMGGWCSKRQACRNYHAESQTEPAERLCERGRDGVSIEFQVVIHRTATTEETQHG